MFQVFSSESKDACRGNSASKGAKQRAWHRHSYSYLFSDWLKAEKEENSKRGPRYRVILGPDACGPNADTY